MANELSPYLDATVKGNLAGTMVPLPIERTLDVVIVYIDLLPSVTKFVKISPLLVNFRAYLFCYWVN